MVPYEASAALSMLLLRDYGMLMVHFVGVPPGTADLLINSCRRRHSNGSGELANTLKQLTAQ